MCQTRYKGKLSLAQKHKQQGEKVHSASSVSTWIHFHLSAVAAGCFPESWLLHERKRNPWALCKHIQICRARVVACIRDVMAGSLPQWRLPTLKTMVLLTRLLGSLADELSWVFREAQRTTGFKCTGRENLLTQPPTSRKTQCHWGAAGRAAPCSSARSVPSASGHFPADQFPRPFIGLVKKNPKPQKSMKCEGGRPLRANKPVNTPRDCKCLH